LVLGRVVCAGGVTAGNGADEEGIGVGVGLGFEDVANAEVNKGGGEGFLYRSAVRAVSRDL